MHIVLCLNGLVDGNYRILIFTHIIICMDSLRLCESSIFSYNTQTILELGQGKFASAPETPPPPHPRRLAIEILATLLTAY
jgi:hypothetical protein